MAAALTDSSRDPVRHLEQVHGRRPAGPQVVQALADEGRRGLACGELAAHALHFDSEPERSHHGNQRRASDIHVADDVEGVLRTLHVLELSRVRKQQLVQNLQLASLVFHALQIRRMARVGEEAKPFAGRAWNHQ